MPIVVVPANVHPCQVDGFPSGAARSRKGAIHIRPISTISVTDDELAFIKETQPELFSRLVIADEQKTKVSLADKLAPIVAKDSKLKAALEAVELEGRKRIEEASAAAAKAKEESRLKAKKQTDPAKLKRIEEIAASDKLAKEMFGSDGKTPKLPPPKVEAVAAEPAVLDDPIEKASPRSAPEPDSKKSKR